MTVAPDIDRMYRESVPIAVILSFWVVLSWIGGTQGLGTGLRLAGIVMALLYIGVRGVTIARSRPTTTHSIEITDVLRENVRALLSAGGWFLAAFLVALIEPYWEAVGLPGIFTSPENSLAFVLTGTGVGTVLLYAIVVGLPRLRSEEPDNELITDR